MQSSLGPGWEHQYPINPNGMITGWGGPGGYAGGGTGWGGSGGGLLGPIGTGAGAGGGNSTTDASGNQWVMSSNGQWVPAGSDYGQGLLGDARLFDPNFYDTSGGYVGADAGTGNETYGSGEGFGVLEGFLGAKPSMVGDDPSYVDLDAVTGWNATNPSIGINTGYTGGGPPGTAGTEIGEVDVALGGVPSAYSDIY